MSSISKSRRNLLPILPKVLLPAGIGLSAAGSFIASCANAKPIAKTLVFTNFDQQPLPYKYDALENVIDAMTMEIHYSKHAAAL